MLRPGRPRIGWDVFPSCLNRCAGLSDPSLDAVEQPAANTDRTHETHDPSDLFRRRTHPSAVLAAPIDNDDGSQTCNASGPSGGTSPGVCANDMALNESYCDGGLSTEPGGGVTCSPSPNSSQPLRVDTRKSIRTLKK